MKRIINRGNVGTNIRKAREEKNISRMELMQMLGYNPAKRATVVSNWELGYELPPLDKIRQLATILDIPIDDLIP